MSFLSEYLEQRRQIRREEDAQRAIDDASPEQLLEALNSNTSYTSDLIGDRTKEARDQTRAVLDSLENVGDKISDLRAHKTPGEIDPKITVQAGVKAAALTNKTLIDINETLTQLLETSTKTEKHLRPELNSKDDTYAKKKEIAAEASKDKLKPAALAVGGGLGALLMNGIFDLWDLARGKKPGPVKPGETAKPGEVAKPSPVKAGEVIKPVGTDVAKPVEAKTGEVAKPSTAESFGRRVGEKVGRAKTVVGDIGSKISKFAEPATTRMGQWVARAAETPLGKSVANVVESGKSFGAKALEASKPAVETLKTGGSKAAEFAGRAAKASKPIISGAATVIDSVHDFGANLINKVKPTTVGSAEGATTGVAEGAVKAVPKAGRALGMVEGVGKVAGRLAVPLAIGMSGYEAYKTEQDETLTRDQKNVKHGSTVGGLTGGLAAAGTGAAIGATVGSVVPVVGTAIGGLVGGVGGYIAGSEVGSYIGEKGVKGYQYVRDNAGKSIDRLSNAYTATKDTVSSGWNSAKDYASNLWSSGKDTAKSAVGTVSNAGATVGAGLLTGGVAGGALAGAKMLLGSPKPVEASKAAVGSLQNAAAPIAPSISTALGASIALAVAPFSQDAREALKTGLMPAMASVGDKMEASGNTMKTGVESATTTMSANIDKSMSSLSASLLGFTTKLSDAWDSAKANVTNAGQSLWAGAKAAAKQASGALSSTGGAIAKGWKEGGVTGAVKGGAKAAKEGFTGIVDNTLGAVSAKFESGKKGVDAISTGQGDHGGVSYGKHQLATNNGSMAKFLKSAEAAPIAAQFQGLTPGTKEFNDKYREITSGKDRATMESAQQAYMQRTHFEPQAAKLKETLGMDVSKEGRAVQEAVFSTATQYGAKSDVISKALAGKDLSKMSDADKVKAIQDYKAANVNTNFRSSSESQRAGVAKRIEEERKILSDIANDPKLNKSATKVDNVKVADAKTDVVKPETVKPETVKPETVKPETVKQTVATEAKPAGEQEVRRSSPKITNAATAPVVKPAPITETYASTKYVPAVGAISPKTLADTKATVTDASVSQQKVVSKSIDTIGYESQVPEMMKTPAYRIAASFQPAISQQATSVAEHVEPSAPVALRAKQSPLPTLNANVPEPTTPVAVTNGAELAAHQVPQQSAPPTSNLLNGFDTAVPKLDNIPLQVTDLGLVLLNIGHV